MKLAVKKESGSIAGGGFHYMLHPMKMETETDSAFFDLIGYIIIEVSDEQGETLLLDARKAIGHQMQVALLTEKHLSNPAGL